MGRAGGGALENGDGRGESKEGPSGGEGGSMGGREDGDSSEGIAGGRSGSSGRSGGSSGSSGGGGKGGGKTISGGESKHVDGGACLVEATEEQLRLRRMVRNVAKSVHDLRTRNRELGRLYVENRRGRC